MNKDDYGYGGSNSKKVFITVTLEPIGVASAKHSPVISAAISIDDLEGSDLPQLVRTAIRRLQEPSDD
jgi:hypothetical protein